MTSYDNIIKKAYNKKDYTWYEADFKSLSQLQSFLRKDPPVNQDVFFKQQSKSTEYAFHGEKLEKAIKYLISDYNEEYHQFLSLKNEISSALKIKVPKRKYILSQRGTRIHMANLVANKPKYMLRLEPQLPTQRINIYFNSGYPCSSSTSQIKTRGILTLNLIKLLEMNHYQINLNCFSITEAEAEFNYENEIIYIKINLKEPTELLDEKKCYFPFCAKEFERRCIFRVQESLKVENFSWGYGYGKCISTSKIRELLDLNETDIIISNPDELGIEGNDIYEDADRFFTSINLDESIKIHKLTK